MNPDLLELAIAAAGGRTAWDRVCELRVEVSIGGPFWTLKGWPPQHTFDQTVTINPVRQHAVFTPWTRPEWRMIADAAADTVTVETLDGQSVHTLHPARASFLEINTSGHWDAAHVGYFVGYGCWNYLTTPYLLTAPGVRTQELPAVSDEPGRTLRRLAVHFPPSIVTHCPHQIFYFDNIGVQHRLDYAVDISGSSPAAHYTSDYRNFNGLNIATKRRVFRQSPAGEVDHRMPIITLDLHDVEVDISAGN